MAFLFKLLVIALAAFGANKYVDHKIEINNQYNDSIRRCIEVKKITSGFYFDQCDLFPESTGKCIGADEANFRAGVRGVNDHGGWKMSCIGECGRKGDVYSKIECMSGCLAEMDWQLGKNCRNAIEAGDFPLGEKNFNSGPAELPKD